MEGFGLRWFTVDEEDLLQTRPVQTSDVLKQAALVGMSAEGVNHLDPGIKSVLLAEDADGRLVLDNPAGKGVLGHEPDDQNDIPRVGDGVLQVMQDPPALGHARARDDDAWLFEPVQLH